MFCANCGYEFEGNFCPNCGQRSTTTATPISKPVHKSKYVRTAIVEKVPSQPSRSTRQSKEPPVARCPKCGSTSLSANKKGFSFVKGAIGGGIGAVVAPVGIVMGLGAGNLGAKKLYVTCLNCGHRWKL